VDFFSTTTHHQEESTRATRIAPTKRLDLEFEAEVTPLGHPSWAELDHLKVALFPLLPAVLERREDVGVRVLLLVARGHGGDGWTFF
jgi:hypothetical protein